MSSVLAITMGDPAGIGPELCLKAVADPAVRALAVPAIFGNAAILRRVAAACALSVPDRVIPLADFAAALDSLDAPAIVDLPMSEPDSVVPGRVSAVCGRAAYDFIVAAIESALAGRVRAVVTAPIHKEALAAAGVRFPGHTEIFAARTGCARYCMLQTSDAISVSFVTTHVAYAAVPALLTVERILETIALTAEAMGRIRGRPARLAVCGLNPHAGEAGLFGAEERELIAPAVAAACARGLSVEGPFPPDTVFTPRRLAAFDAAVCMYHDQGHIPLKALAFDSAVNVTLGLPIVRTSVDHGTAFDIAWRGLAEPGSLLAAIRLAVRLTTPTVGRRARGAY